MTIGRGPPRITVPAGRNDLVLEEKNKMYSGYCGQPERGHKQIGEMGPFTDTMMLFLLQFLALAATLISHLQMDC